MDIILASQSPRRLYLLNSVGLRPRCVDSKVSEIFMPGAEIYLMAEQLALQKARAVAAQNTDSVVIGGDTIIQNAQKLLEKPENRQQAAAMLQSYSDNLCSIVSAVAVVYERESYSHVLSDRAEVYFKPIPKSVVEKYLDQEEFIDKAGALALQSPLLRPYIRSIQGRQDTILGLPTHLLAELLEPLSISIDYLAGDASILYATA